MSFNCKHCGKEYSSQSSRSNHIRIFHNDIVIQKNPLVIQPCPPNVIQNNPEFKCNNCPNTYKYRQGLWKHEQKCTKKITIDNDNKIEKLEKENLETKKELENLKNMLQRALKIHPKTLNKINNQLNNSGTINNVTIIQLGQENLSEILNTREKKNILNRQAMSLNDLVDLVHVSGKYKNFQNVYITNLQSTFAYKFDEKANKFIAVNKNELLNDLVDSRMYDIEKFYEEICPDLEPKKAEQIKKFIDRMGNEEDGLKGIKKEEIKLILYNNKDKIKANFNKDTLLLENEVID
jgi:hypothetical protein